MLAIHYDDHPINFCHAWINYCQEKKIPYKIVNCLESDFLEKMKGFTGLLWQWHQGDFTHDIIAKDLLTVIENYLNKPVFPDFATRWHFDDKLIETILFDIFQVKIPKYWYFFDQVAALKWSENAIFPIIFKLRKGASSANVKLIVNKQETKKIIKKMFSQGLSPSRIQLGSMVKSRGFFGLLRAARMAGFKRIRRIIENRRSYAHEKGYIYFQEYIPNCQYDIRVLIVCGRAYAFRRFVRDNDFRASGSGKIDFDTTKVNIESIKIGFVIYEKLQPQTIALDFLETSDGLYLLEMSYAFVNNVKPIWPGYWDNNLIWHDESINPLGLIVEDLLSKVDSAQYE